MREGTTSIVMAADRPYGEFYDFYSLSPEYFGYTLVLRWLHYYTNRLVLLYCHGKVLFTLFEVSQSCQNF
jgi:hypothetical protein